MKRINSILIAFLIVASFAFGQETTTQTSAPATTQQYVMVPVQTPVAAPAVQLAVQKVAQQVLPPNQFADVGSAIGAGLNGLVQSIGGATGNVVDKSVDVTGKAVDRAGGVATAIADRTFGKDVTLVDGIEKVSKTDAGRFTMLVIAWKVMGKDALDLLRHFTGVAIGIPLEVVLLCIATWVTRRFWMIRSSVTSSEGPFWNKKKTYELVNVKVDDDTRYTGLFITWLAFAVLSIMNIAFVIL